MEVKEEVEILSSVTKESLSEKVPLRKWARESCRFLQRDPPGRGGHRHAVQLVVQSPRQVWLFVTPWAAARQAPLSVGFSK